VLLEAKVYDGLLLQFSRLHNIFYKIRTAYQNMMRLTFEGLENSDDHASENEVHAFLQLVANSKEALSESSSMLNFLKAKLRGVDYRLLERAEMHGEPHSIGGHCLDIFDIFI